MLAAGAAGIVMILLKFKDSIWHLCPQCSTFHYVCIGVASFLAFMGLIGLMAIEMKSKWVLILYKLGLFLLFLLACAFTALVILLKLGTLDHLLEIGWDEGVAHNPENVCEFQQLFHCTGWNDVCPFPLLNTTIACPMCPPDLTVNGTSSCSQKMHDTANNNFHPLLFGGLGAIAAIALTNFIAYCAGRQFRYVDDSDDYLDDRALNDRLLEERRQIYTGGSSSKSSFM